MLLYCDTVIVLNSDMLLYCDTVTLLKGEMLLYCVTVIVLNNNMLLYCDHSWFVRTLRPLKPNALYALKNQKSTFISRDQV